MAAPGNYFAALDSEDESGDEIAQTTKVQPKRRGPGGARMAAAVPAGASGARRGTSGRVAGTLNSDVVNRPIKGDRPAGRGRGGGRTDRPRNQAHFAAKHGGYDRHSGTGRGKEVRKGGNGRGNWGNEGAESRKMEAIGDAVEALRVAESEGREPAAPVADGGDAEQQPAEEEPAGLSYEDYLKQLEEKRKGLGFENTEETKVEFDAAGVKVLGKKTEQTEQEFASLLGSGRREQRKSPGAREVPSKMRVDPSDLGFRVSDPSRPAPRGGGRGGRGGGGRGGEGFRGGRGRGGEEGFRGGRGRGGEEGFRGGRGRGGEGFRGGRGAGGRGGPRGGAPNVNDPSAFPTLGGR